MYSGKKHKMDDQGLKYTYTHTRTHTCCLNIHARTRAHTHKLNSNYMSRSVNVMTLA